MLSLLRKSLSGENQHNAEENAESAQLKTEPKNVKRTRSKSEEEAHQDAVEVGNKQKNSKISKQKRVSRDSQSSQSSASSFSSLNKSESEPVPVGLPDGTPEWGTKLLEIIQGEFRNLNSKIGGVEDSTKSNSKSIKQMENKLARVEKHNAALLSENNDLKERLLELDYQQQHKNLLFEGISDAAGETDLECIRKLRFILQHVPGIDPLSTV